jgi:NitT/TauT family transport system substrate-binding protein
MHRMLTWLAATVLTLGFAGEAASAPFKVAWSHYTGWEPWGYAADQGIVKKWADKYGIEIEVTLVNDYIESVNLYTAGNFDAVTVTNMDALSIPAVGGVDTTALILGDFSNGNDGIVVKGADSVKALKGKSIKLVELSVSHYLLARALDKNGMAEKDIKVVNTSDADIGSVFASGGAGEAVVTWNPILMSIRNTKDAKMVFDSSQIPSEIIDMLVVRTSADDKLKKALTGAWYETMKLMNERGKTRDAAVEAMAQQAGGTRAEFEAQLKTTAMLFEPSRGAALARSKDLMKTMKYVATFSFDHGLYGAGAKSADLVGIQFPDGTIQGDPKNVKLRFDATYMEMAANGKL